MRSASKQFTDIKLNRMQILMKILSLLLQLASHCEFVKKEEKRAFAFPRKRGKAEGLNFLP
jgi:hypothetical protein